MISSCHSSNLNVYVKLKHVYFPLVMLATYLLMLIISHSELGSSTSCNIQQVGVYTGTLHYSYMEVAILCCSYNLGLLVINILLIRTKSILNFYV